MQENKPLIVGITGASGAIYGIRLLMHLRKLGIKTHLVISKAAQLTIPSETEFTLAMVQKLADEVHMVGNIGACIASGSYRARGMIIAPCSVRSFSEIATGVTSSLLTRSADVMLKEKRKLVLMVRETPLHAGHLENLLKLAQMGAVIAPPVPAFYQRPKSIEEMVDHSLARVLDAFDIEHDLAKPWAGI
jgi:4-hydroxy-3-polyprenylbenzoate decarboxylase